MLRHPFLSLSLILAVAGCQGGASPVVPPTTATSFARLSEDDRFLAARALAIRTADRGRGAIPVAEWLPVYLEEPSPRVADALESALESALGGPVVARLVSEARTGTPLAEKAALKLLADDRKAVRLCGVRALSSCRSPSSAERLETLFLSDGEDLDMRLASAEGLVAHGRDRVLADWCAARGLSPREVPVSFSESSDDPVPVDPLTRGVLSALGAGGSGKGGESW